MTPTIFTILPLSHSILINAAATFDHIIASNMYNDAM